MSRATTPPGPPGPAGSSGTLAAGSTPFWVWAAASGALVTGFALLAVASWRFGYAFEVSDMPIPALVAGLVALGAVYLVLAFLTARSVAEPGADNAGTVNRRTRNLLWLIGVTGLVARLFMLASEPILEDDYQRYLWDGALSANAISPYRIAPADVGAPGQPEAMRQLAHSASVVLERINHPEIRTIYPPGAQAFFALAYTIKPFNLTAWRLICLVMDIASLGLILALLRSAGRAPLWAALYWLNPLVIKELINSAHMEAVLMPFVLGALLLTVRRRPIAASTALAVAVGIKIWPAALLPLVLRNSARAPGPAMAAAGIFALLVAAFALPMVLAGLDRSAGLVAYASDWHTNSAMFDLFSWLASGPVALIDALTGREIPTGIGARCVIAAIIAASGLLVAFRPAAGAGDLMWRSGLLVAIIFLVSPAQFPWYGVWIAPFLPFVPWAGLLAVAVSLPLYYYAFALMNFGATERFNAIVIWVEWLPIWALLMLEVRFGPWMAAGSGGRTGEPEKGDSLAR